MNEEEEIKAQYDRLREPIDKMFQLKDTRINIKYALVRNTISISSILLGVLVSIQDPPNQNENQYHSILSFLMVGTQILLLVAILFGMLGLRGQLKQLDSFLKRIEEYVSLLLYNKNYGGNNIINSGEVHIIYRIYEMICFCSFFLSLVGLVFISFLKEFHS